MHIQKLIYVNLLNYACTILIIYILENTVTKPGLREYGWNKQFINFTVTIKRVCFLGIVNWSVPIVFLFYGITFWLIFILMLGGARMRRLHICRLVFRFLWYVLCTLGFFSFILSIAMSVYFFILCVWMSIRYLSPLFFFTSLPCWPPLSSLRYDFLRDLNIGKLLLILVYRHYLHWDLHKKTK